MAFLTRKKVGNRKYLQVVENYRENGKHRQRVLLHVGPYASVEHALVDYQHDVGELRTRLSSYGIAVDEAELERLRGLLEGERWRENMRA